VTAEIVRRGKEALDRKRRDFDDWMLIAEAHQIGRAEAMQTAQTNRPTGRRYEKAMAEWLLANSFNVIDKCTRNHLFECLEHRADIEKWRARLTEPERFRFNHPTSVLRKWKAATVIPDPNAAPKISAIAKLREANVELQEKLHRTERELSLGGGNLWTLEDTPEDIAMAMLVKFPPAKAERVARAILKKLKDSRTDHPERPPRRIPANSEATA
jgi:hypothetical protein